MRVSGVSTKSSEDTVEPVGANDPLDREGRLKLIGGVTVGPLEPDPGQSGCAVAVGSS